MAPRDVYSSLAELQEKLQQLQRELSAAGRPDPGSGSDPGAAEEHREPLRSVSVATSSESGDAAGRAAQDLEQAVASLDRQIDALADLRDRLIRVGRQLAEAAQPPAEYRGRVTLNAGPFPDIPTLGEFERALQRLPGAEDVHVAGFEGDRALIELRLGLPIRLVDELERTLPFRFRVVRGDRTSVTVELES
jgi:hypothetical protein